MTIGQRQVNLRRVAAIEEDAATIPNNTDHTPDRTVGKGFTYSVK